MTGGSDLARGLAAGDWPESLAPADAAMLRYAVKLTRRPADMTSADVGALRAVGFRDRAILDVCHVASYYNYVNRLADGLGVELEERWSEADLTLTRAEFEAARARRRRDPPA